MNVGEGQTSEQDNAWTQFYRLLPNLIIRTTVITWAHMPYMADTKSVHRSGDILQQLIRG